MQKWKCSREFVTFTDKDMTVNLVCVKSILRIVCKHIINVRNALLKHVTKTVNWFQRCQWTRPQRLRAENTAYFFKILIPYFIYLAVFLAFKFGWVVNNTFFFGVTNSEHTFNIDFTWTLKCLC